jgi:HTH-type transcriptional regulator/antitoxin HigA
MDVRPIMTEADYDWALTEVTRYFENEPPLGSPEGNRFQVLLGLIESYEAKHWPIEGADPVEAIQFAMDQRGYTQADLARLLGSRSRASEILNRKRPLTMQMAYRLHREWKIPAETLIAPYHTDASPGETKAASEAQAERSSGSSPAEAASPGAGLRRRRAAEATRKVPKL